MGREPRLSQLAVLGLARDEVEKVDAEAEQHQHLHVETVPVGAQVQRDLPTNNHIFFFTKKND